MLFSVQVVDDAIGAGVDGYDGDTRTAVQKAVKGLRLPVQAALDIASKAVSRAVHALCICGGAFRDVAALQGPLPACAPLSCFALSFLIHSQDESNSTAHCAMAQLTCLPAQVGAIFLSPCCHDSSRAKCTLTAPLAVPIALLPAFCLRARAGARHLPDFLLS